MVNKRPFQRKFFPHRKSVQTRPLESHGPRGKIRGTAMQIYNQYCALARDSKADGDRVMAERYLQSAEHYYRRAPRLNSKTAPVVKDTQEKNAQEKEPSSITDVSFLGEKEEEKSSS